MSGPERKAPDDKLLEDFLEGRSPASRAWREAMRSESAPAELDDTVLGMAREEIRAAAATPPSRDRFRDRRWPFALAAVLVLSFSTLLTIVQDPVAHKDAMMVTPDVAPTESVILPEASAPVAATAPARAERSVQADATAPQAASAKRGRAQDFPAKPSSASEAAGSGSYADAMQEPADAAAASSAGPEAEAMSAPAPAPAAPPPAAAPVMEENREAVPAELKAAPAAEMRRRAETADFLGAAKLRREAAEPAATAAAQLQRIRRMLAEGQEEEARQALEAWRKDWPERTVPADLQRLLE